MRMLTCGSLAMDVIFQASDLPVDDGFALIEKEQVLPGGSSANVTVSAAGYGVEARQVGVVGDDDFGKEFIKSLRESNVDTSFFIEKPGRVTMHTYIVVAPGGRHTIFAHFGDCREGFCISEIDERLLDDIDIYYTDMFNSVIAHPLLLKAHEQGKRIIFNMQSVMDFMKICQTSRDQIIDSLQFADLIIGGISTLRSINEEDESLEIESVVENLYNEFMPDSGVICTLGSKGAIWRNSDGLIRKEAYELAEVVDTTGAGDSFLGGFIYANYQEKMKREECLAFGNASAALCCKEVGARSISTVEDVIRFQKSQL